jgi:hypothetical protein
VKLTTRLQLVPSYTSTPMRPPSAAEILGEESRCLDRDSNSEYPECKSEALPLSERARTQYEHFNFMYPPPPKIIRGEPFRRSEQPRAD